MKYTLLDFFTDPVLRAPTIGSILMCVSSSLAGVIVLLRKRALIGESLSHASYPGIALGSIFLYSLLSPQSDLFALGVLFFAFIFAVAAMFVIELLQKRFNVKDDAALCFVLSSFFGLGVLIASQIQTTHAMIYRQVQTFLYGQSATMLDIHIYVYGALFLLTAFVVTLLYREIQVLTFDRSFGISIGIRVKLVDVSVLLLTTLAIVVGIRSVGVVMMAGMLIAPALTARQLTISLKKTFFIASLVGALSGFIGNYLSVMIPVFMGEKKFSLPTGPMILLSASCFFLLALLFSRERGLFTRLNRVRRFKKNCQRENILKMLWKEEQASCSLQEISRRQNLSKLITFFRLKKLEYKKLITSNSKGYFLTNLGKEKAERIVRLHRLWELYLVHLGHCKDKVHASAEDMEHVITKELEVQLSELLDHPQMDPHNQPIPRGGERK